MKQEFNSITKYKLPSHIVVYAKFLKTTKIKILIYQCKLVAVKMNEFTASLMSKLRVI